MKTINIADDKDRKIEDYAVFHVTDSGDVLFEHDPIDTDNGESIVCRVLDDPTYAGTPEEWIASVSRRMTD